MVSNGVANAEITPETEIEAGILRRGHNRATDSIDR
jgi:hypothetical protein